MSEGSPFVGVYTTGYLLDVDIVPSPWSNFPSHILFRSRTAVAWCLFHAMLFKRWTNYLNFFIDHVANSWALDRYLSSGCCTMERFSACRSHPQHLKYCSKVWNAPESLEAESPFWQALPLLDIPRKAIIDHIRPPLCLNLSPVVGIGFSALRTQSSISSAGNSIRKIPLQKYAAQATTVAINASIQ